jgi:hypothetical protein
MYSISNYSNIIVAWLPEATVARRSASLGLESRLGACEVQKWRIAHQFQSQLLLVPFVLQESLELGR